VKKTGSDLSNPLFFVAEAISRCGETRVRDASTVNVKWSRRGENPIQKIEDEAVRTNCPSWMVDACSLGAVRRESGGISTANIGHVARVAHSIGRIMPSLQSYNPIVIGFIEGKGTIHVPLRVAQDDYGQLPSEYGLLPGAARRRGRKTLNLPMGLAIIDLLRDGEKLQETRLKFYDRWGRDFRADFRVEIGFFHRRNDPWDLWQVVDKNRATLAECMEADPVEYLHAGGLVPLSTLRSIPSAQLLEKAKEILARRRRHPAHESERERIDQALAFLQAQGLLGELAVFLGRDVRRWGKDRLASYADPAAQLLWELSRHLPMVNADRLSCVRGRDVEMEFAPRDASFLGLGKTVGDCTADKPFRQVDRDVENIYWTVFSWFLDRHYQILKVYYDGHFVMKVHLLPLVVVDRNDAKIFLAVDAIETAPVFREDTPAGRPDLLEKKEYIFSKTIAEVQRLAGLMGIDHVYAERFSNTAWVRQEMERFPEVYLHIASIQKIDELEDVFELSKRVCAAAGRERPSSVFMELQMKNTFLLPGATTVRGVKVYAVLAGDASLGLPMKRVFGV